MKKLFILFFVVASTSSMFAQIATFGFTATPFTSATTTDPNLTATAVTLSPSGTISTNVTSGAYFLNEPYIGGTSGWTSTSQSGAKAFCFTITPAAGFMYSITGVTANAYATAAGPSAGSIRIGATDFTPANLPSAGTAVTALSASTSSFNDLTTGTTICVQGWLNGSRTTAGTGDYRIDDIVVTGTVTPIVMPVALKSFVALTRGSTNQISFTTASERNNSHFEIERSADGQAFRNIGEVKGAGNSNDEKNYTFTDEKPLAGTNYYRLKQVDLDGQFEYSKVVTARFGREGSLSVIPTLVVDNLQVSLDETSTENGTWEIIDLSGRQVLAGTIEAEQGAFQADLSSLQEGSYIVRVQMGATVLTERVMKL
jgi:hypothetical protein